MSSKTITFESEQIASPIIGEGIDFANLMLSQLPQNQDALAEDVEVNGEAFDTMDENDVPLSQVKQADGSKHTDETKLINAPSDEALVVDLAVTAPVSVKSNANVQRSGLTEEQLFALGSSPRMAHTLPLDRANIADKLLDGFPSSKTATISNQPHSASGSPLNDAVIPQKSTATEKVIPAGIPTPVRDEGRTGILISSNATEPSQDAKPDGISLNQNIRAPRGGSAGQTPLHASTPASQTDGKGATNTTSPRTAEITSAPMSDFDGGEKTLETRPVATFPTAQMERATQTVQNAHPSQAIQHVLSKSTLAGPENAPPRAEKRSSAARGEEAPTLTSSDKGAGTLGGGAKAVFVPEKQNAPLSSPLQSQSAATQTGFGLGASIASTNNPALSLLKPVEVSDVFNWEDPRIAQTTFGTMTPLRSDVAPQIARQLVEVMAQAANRPVDIALSPHELGRVRMSVRTEDGAVTVQIIAERADTLNLMRRHIDQLGQTFRAMGYDTISFSFGAGDENGAQSDGHRNEAQNATSDQSEGIANPAEPALINLDRSPITGVDIRL